MNLQVFTDGASRGNPGDAGIGVVIKHDGKIVKEIYAYIGKQTNNYAEYAAAIRGLTEAITLGATSVELFCDSELLIKQFNREYRVKNQSIIPLFAKLNELARKIKKITATHIYRELNKEADKLANIGIDSKKF